MCHKLPTKAPRVEALLAPLDGVCTQRHEGWWSFELCYGTHARQFHVETVEASDGRKKAKVAAEFSLGDRMEKRRKPSSASDRLLSTSYCGTHCARAR